MPDDLGPLPEGDRNDTLEQLSLRAFNNALPVDKFLFRDERVSDKGVDGTLEVKHGKTFTNCRAQVQLKGTDADPAKAFNADGSYSKSLDSSNLNYLLNGQSALYGGSTTLLIVNNLSRFAHPAELHMAAFEGLVPHELLGRVSFPRIGELPYFVTLPPHGFFWFQLCADEEA